MANLKRRLDAMEAKTRIDSGVLIAEAYIPGAKYLVGDKLYTETELNAHIERLKIESIIIDDVPAQ